MSVLVIWPSRCQIRATLPECLQKLFSKTRTITDCTEVLMDTPSSLDVQASLLSDYKHHCTIKILVCITSNGAVSWVSPVYGERSSDIHTVRDSGFLNLLEPFDQVMADKGFEIKTDLALKQCYLRISPSAAKGSQIVKKDANDIKYCKCLHICWTSHSKAKRV